MNLAAPFLDWAGRGPRPASTAGLGAFAALLCALATFAACKPATPPPAATAAPAAEPGAAEPGAAKPAVDTAAPGDDDEAVPRGPAVEVNVAEDPSAPLAYFRGFSTERGHESALLYSRSAKGRAPVAIEDSLVALRGVDKANGARRGPAQVAVGGPMVVSIGAKWCKPCGEEIGDVLALAGELDPNGPADRVRLLMLLEGTPDEWPLAEVRDELLAKHAKFTKRSKPLSPNAWAEFRADLQSAWGDAVGRLSVLGGANAVALPVNLLLDGCGHVQAAATGSLNDAKREAFRKQITKLQGLTCTAAPMPVVPLPRPAVARPRPAEAHPAEAHPAEPHLAEPHLAEPHLAEPHLAEPSHPGLGPVPGAEVPMATGQVPANRPAVGGPAAGGPGDKPTLASPPPPSGKAEPADKTEPRPEPAAKAQGKAAPTPEDSK